MDRKVKAGRVTRRRYRPFLIFNPARGWAFYTNPGVSPLTVRTVGNPYKGKRHRERIGWFVTAQFASMMEARYHRIG